jgi:hypothetical protein
MPNFPDPTPKNDHTDKHKNRPHHHARIVLDGCPQVDRATG